MTRRTKFLMICTDIDKTRDECLEWYGVLKEHLGDKVKSIIEERRIETPFAIIDFAYVESIYGARGYSIILKLEEDDEKVLRLAIGEEPLK